MVPEGFTRVYPVYRWHVTEVDALAAVVNRLYEWRQKSGPADDQYFFLSGFRDRLSGLADLLHGCREPVAYLNRADRELVEKITGYLKQNPDILDVIKTA